jgi:hypothetical protein
MVIEQVVASEAQADEKEKSRDGGEKKKKGEKL